MGWVSLHRLGIGGDVGRNGLSGGIGCTAVSGLWRTWTQKPQRVGGLGRGALRESWWERGFDVRDCRRQEC